jgi:glyoxalase family protein
MKYRKPVLVGEVGHSVRDLIRVSVSPWRATIPLMQHPILGLHHVTATVDDAQQDLDFCLDALGLRLVKKTVNFDNHHVYHFYYGDERGTPGTIWTTFPYKGRGVPIGKKGAGQIAVTSFSVPAGSLDFWNARLRASGIAVDEVAPRFGEESIAFSDASGLRFELVATDRDDRRPWTAGGVAAGAAIRGLHSVTMVVRSPARTLELMTGLLGYSVVNEADGRIRLAANGDAPGKTIEIVHAPDAQPALNGLGTVHHVAMAVANADEQLRLRQELLRLGLTVTDVRDRCYFTSIYFREPGGVLFEAATVPPGFTIDEDVSSLGQALKLPPWEEPHRAEIESGLAKVRSR